jgi:hypothetical protein
MIPGRKSEMNGVGRDIPIDVGQGDSGGDSEPSDRHPRNCSSCLWKQEQTPQGALARVAGIAAEWFACHFAPVGHDQDRQGAQTR